ncbi:MAG: 23S rRNA (guanosine(2251)-2'-O)-methyltransferase RlmB [Flavobacteriaceae bacterium]|nr:23S rRNA (guanosine(2251)-2'-O)-methyltransferase RlmB [Flavobacteriaceae bacterium]
MEETSYKRNVIFGLRSVIEAIKSEQTIEKVFLVKDLKGDIYSELATLLKKERINFSFVPSEKLDKLSKHGNHQGAAATISPIVYPSLDEIVEKTKAKGKPALYLLLDQISDVRNFGAIIRTAECTGVDAIIIQTSGNAPMNPDTIKTSAGAAFKVPICRVDHIKDAVYHLQSEDVNIVAATEKTDETIFDADFTGDIAIIMGSEGRGINPSILRLVDQKAKLPLYGEIDSLNVSVACGAILYEAIRQRLTNK